MPPPPWLPVRAHAFSLAVWQDLLLSQLLKMARKDFVQQIFTANLHCHFLAQIGEIDRADEIIKRSKPYFSLLLPIKKRKVFSVRVMIADEVVKNGGGLDAKTR